MVHPQFTGQGYQPDAKSDRKRDNSRKIPGDKGTVKLEGTHNAREKPKHDNTHTQDDKDPSTLTLWKQAVKRSGEIKHKTMTDIERRSEDEKFRGHSSKSSDHRHQHTRARKHARGPREGRQTKNSTDNVKQLEQEELKHINGLSQLSSDRFPPQSNTRSVVYFQNRFIILDHAADRIAGSTNSTINTGKHDKDTTQLKSAKMDSMETSFSKINTSSDSRHKNKEIEMDASSVTMDARGIDIILTDPDNSSKQIKNMDSFNTEESKKHKTIWRKIHRVLLDDRVKASNGQIVLESRHPEEYRILKKVLNILFLTIGITLFLSVIIVVVYAFIVGDDKVNDSNSQPTASTTTKGAI